MVILQRYLDSFFNCFLNNFILTYDYMEKIIKIFI